MTAPLARVQYAEDGSHPLLPYIARAEEGDDFYEIPEVLIAGYEQAKESMRAAETAIADYITRNQVPKQDGWVAAGWVTEDFTR